MLDHLELFGMGYSWGGYESLLIPTHPETSRTAAPWRVEGVPMRIHVGLEDLADLIRDLEAGFGRRSRRCVWRVRHLGDAADTVRRA